MPQHDEARTQLEQRLQQLNRRIGKIEGDLRRTLDPDSEERAAELENDEVLQQLDADSLAEVRQIREALERIENGTYGICAKCGGAIAAQRLAAMPSSPTCLACAS